MANSLRNLLRSVFKRLPITYSLLLMILVPLSLVINTMWNLNSYERDMNFGVREQAIGVKDTLFPIVTSLKLTNEELKDIFVSTTHQSQSIESITLFAENSDGTLAQQVGTTSTKTLEPGFIENLAYSQGSEYFTKEYDPNIQNTVWKLVTPFTNENGNVSVISLTVNALRVDAIVGRTARDSMIIMVISVIIVVLLLTNHAQALERSFLVDKLKGVDRMKDDFISVASHELRTPLTAIKGYVSLLQKDLQISLTEKQRTKFGVVMESIYRLETLVNDLLNVSRIEQGRLDFTITSVDVATLIQETVRQLDPVAKEKGLGLTAINIPTSLQAMGNADRLREVLTNIVGNAIKYTPSGSVTISTTTERNKVQIIVQDTGIGIAPDDRKHLFQKFSRIQTDKTRDIPGTGLGLWITKQLIEQMKGSIFVDSVGGKGTTFTIVLLPA